MIALFMEAVSIFGMWVNFYETARGNIPKTVIFILAAVRN
jgi:hypothetical protein